MALARVGASTDSTTRYSYNARRGQFPRTRIGIVRKICCICAEGLHFSAFHSSRTCNEAVRGDMGLESLQGRRDKAKLKWWYKLACMEGDRYPHKLFRQIWNI